MSASASSLSLPPWALGPFFRPDNARPLIHPNAASRFDCPLRQEPVAWEARHTFNPAAVVHEGRVVILYRAEDDQGPGGIGGYTSRLGLAVSDDGITFRTEPHPVYFPAEDAQKPFEWTGGCEDPRLATGPDGTYVLTFTQFPGRNPAGGNFPWRVGLATSRDLRTWTKHGSAFQGTPHESLRIKSAGILQTLENGRLVAARVRGKYWMYFGESFVSIASSDDLVHWAPLTDAHGAPLQIMRPRSGFFDSEFTEVGPPPLLTEHGIVLVYNGKNRDQAADGDPNLPTGAYACGQALFDKDDPVKFITRLDRPFFQPELDWETAGQYEGGTTFAEGLVFFQGRWLLYYGCADTFVGCAHTSV